MGVILAQTLYIMGELVCWLIFISAILSWFVSANSGVMRVLNAMTDPILAPFRAALNRLIRRPMQVDYAPILAYVVISYVIVPALQSFVLKLFI